MLNDELLRRLDGFIRKFYKNLLLKGLLYSVVLLIVFFLLLAVFEHLNYSSSLARTLIFYSYLAFAAIVLIVFIIRPALKLMKIGKTIDYFQAARIIGEHFPEVEDKLLNLLQLKELSKTEASDLLLAGIEQKTRQLSIVPFNKAIDKRKVKKASLAAAVVVVLVLLVSIIFPNMLGSSAMRYVKHSTYFAKPAPFEFLLQTKSLTVLQQEDLNIVVKTSGKALPEQSDIRVGGQTYRMKKEGKNTFSFTIRQINKDTEISFLAAGVESRPYIIKVKPKPVLVSLSAHITYPAYTRREAQTLSGINRLSVPKGSKIEWKAQTRDTKELIFKTGDKVHRFTPDNKGNVSFFQTILSDVLVSAGTKNEHTSFSDSLQFEIEAIEDLYPQIAVIEQKDSLLAERVLFRGQIKDDYGFSRLEFKIEKKDAKNGQGKVLHSENLEVTHTDNVQEFYHAFNLSDLQLKKGETIEYYFTVWDNDAVNGNKSAKSSVFTLKLPSEEELEEVRESNSKELKSETEDLLSEIKQLQKQIEQMSRKLIEKKELSWQERQELEQLAEKQEELKEQIEQIKEKLHENNRLDEKLSPEQEEILQKQKELERLMDKLLNNEMKDLMQQIQNLKEEALNKQKLQDALDKIKQNNTEIGKELDRNIEMYKRLEIEKKTNEVTQKMRELSEKQKELSKDLKKQDKESLQQKQQELSREFERSLQKLDSVQKDMQRLEQPMDLKRDKQKEKDINTLQKQAEKDLEKKNTKSAQQKMQQAAQKMQELAEDLEQQQQEQQEEQLGEDIEQVRAMLKNLVRLSMQQEELIAKTKSTRVSDAAYQDILRVQNNIREDMKAINDSLFAMSKRQPAVGEMINSELEKISNHTEKAVETLLRFNQAHYANHRNNNATSSQQYAMTSMNNLALMLTESLENMKKQQKQGNNQKGKPNQSCNNPSQGKGQKSQKSMRELQEALNKELERLQKELERQAEHGKPKIGESARLNEQIAKAAAQQELIRKMVQHAAEEAKRSGGKPNKKLEEMQRQMEQTEKEIVNKTISRRTMNRQAEILTRMLESEKAQKKKGEDFERKSNEGKDSQRSSSEVDFSEFEKLKKRDMKLFKQIPPIYSPFYKQKVNDYFYGSGGTNE